MYEYDKNNLLFTCTKNNYPKDAEIILSTFGGCQQDHDLDLSNIEPSGESFAFSAIEAWATHQHLVIRPDEVWFAILVQMNFYMTNNAERLRHLFVSHKGQKDLLVTGATWLEALGQFRHMIHKNIKVDWLREWIMPSFTTSQPDDNMTANILFMGLMKDYFAYYIDEICGIPSITLLGDLEDWKKLLEKIDRLPFFGEEPAQYRNRLRPTLNAIVHSFQHPQAASSRDFWNKIIVATPQRVCGRPPFSVSGWISSLFFWNSQGKPLPSQPITDPNAIYYGSLDLHNIPSAVVSVPITMLTNEGEIKFEGMLIAGNIGKQKTRGAPEDYQRALDRAQVVIPRKALDINQGTIRPISGWVLYGPVPRDWDSGPGLGEINFEAESAMDALSGCK